MKKLKRISELNNIKLPKLMSHIIDDYLVGKIVYNNYLEDFEGEDNLEYGDRFMFYHYRSLLSDQGIDVSNIKNAKQLLQSLEAICEQLEIVIVELMK